MATLATIWKDVFTAGAGRQRSEAARNPESAYSLRALPNEDIYFYTKSIDNRRVVREANPEARASCWRTIGAGCVAALMVIAFLLPSAYSLLAGYQISALETERKRLDTEMMALNNEESRLLSPERLAELARLQQFIDPAPGTVVPLNPDSEGTVAMNMHKGK